MKRKEIKKKIEEVLKYHAELDAQWRILEKVLGIDTSVGLANLSWSLFDKFTDSVSREIGDEFQHLSWFIWEAGLGSKGFEVIPGAGKKKVVIKSVDDLVELIKNK